MYVACWLVALIDIGSRVTRVAFIQNTQLKAVRVLPKGMEPTQDPILHARSAAYADSYRRRAREKFLDQFSAGEDK